MVKLEALECFLFLLNTLLEKASSHSFKVSCTLKFNKGHTEFSRIVLIAFPQVKGE